MYMFQVRLSEMCIFSSFLATEYFSVLYNWLNKTRQLKIHLGLSESTF